MLDVTLFTIELHVAASKVEMATSKQYLDNVPQFEAESNFEEWVELLEANEITDDNKQRSVFLTNL